MFIRKKFEVRIHRGEDKSIERQPVPDYLLTKLMGISCRIFFVEQNGHVRRIPYTRFRKFYFLEDKDERFPEYAGQRLRYAFVIVELENRQLIEIKRSDFSILQFDSAGRLDKKEWLRGVQLGMDASPYSYSKPTLNSVIDAKYRFSKKRHDHEFRWKPNKQVMTEIKEAIFGKPREPLKLI